MIEVKVEGLSELREAMLKLPQALQAGPLRRAVSAAAKVVQDEARLNAPVDDGVLKRAIYRARDKENSSRVQEGYIVGVRYGRRYRKRGQDAWYWRFVEFGTARTPAQPFLRPAFMSTQGRQLERMREVLARAIELAAAKLNRRKG